MLDWLFFLAIFSLLTLLGTELIRAFRVRRRSHGEM
jgi:hypothetical protein